MILSRDRYFQEFVRLLIKVKDVYRTFFQIKQGMKAFPGKNSRHTYLLGRDSQAFCMDLFVNSRCNNSQNYRPIVVEGCVRHAE